MSKSRPSSSNSSNSNSNRPVASTSTIRKTTSTNPSTSTSNNNKVGKIKQDDSLDFSKTKLISQPSLISYTNLHKLNLMECGLKSIGFVKEAKLTLTWLNVSGNDLSAKNAWDGVEELSRLFVLNASNCSLREVPSIVESLHSLKALVITHNSLTSLTHIKSLSNLNTLVVSNNSLASLPESITTLPSLKKISAAHNLLTPTSIPNLSVNAQLKEIKFNDNPLLTSLPSHFSSWGKGSLAGIDFKGKRKGGLEIVDLGACGFKDWSGLRELAGQEGIVNLGLKGNVVAEDAKLDGFEEFRNKITILLPALRILDGQRFDPKFFDLKAKRALRPAEQRIVDSGPMGLAINAAASAPIEVAKEVERRRKRKLDLVERDEAEERELEEIKRKKLEEKDVRRKAFEEQQKKDGIVSSVVGELKKKKKVSSKRKVEEIDGEEKEVVPELSKKEMYKKKAKEAKEAANPTPTTIEESISSPPPKEPTPPPISTEPIEPLTRKRGRKSAHISTLTTPLLPSTKSTSTDSIPLPKVPRKKKSAGGVLSALKGSEAEQAEEKEKNKKKKEKKEEFVPTGANAVLEKPDQEIIQKEKTSVLKVVEVKRQKKEKNNGGNNEAASFLMGKQIIELGVQSWDD